MAVILLGMALGAAGGAVAYRALFVEPRSTVVISERGVSERPDLWRAGGGTALLAAGAALAFLAARRRRQVRKRA